MFRRCDGIGRRAGLKIQSWRQGAGSTPASGTKIAETAFAVSAILLPSAVFVEPASERSEEVSSTPAEEKWTVESGKWKVESGKLKIESGEWKIEN